MIQASLEAREYIRFNLFGNGPKRARRTSTPSELSEENISEDTIHSPI